MSESTYTLRRAREHAGLTREEVSSRCGFSAKTLERWEKANRCRLPAALMLASVYGLELEELDFERAPARSAA